MTSSSKHSIPVESLVSAERLRDVVLPHIFPFFLDAATDDPTEAREAARQMLVCYNAATGKELQLAAQVVAFGMAALDCLRCAMTERDLPVQALLRMQSNAVTLNGLAERSRNALEARQRDRHKGQASTPEARQLDEAEFQAAIGKARQMVAFARTKLEAHRVAKALASGTSSTNAGRSGVRAPLLSPMIAEQMTPKVLARRKNGDSVGARVLPKLTRSQGQTRH